MTDDAVAEAIFHLDQLGALAFLQSRNRDVGPGADDFGDVFFGDLFLEESRSALHLFELFLRFVEGFFLVGKEAVLNLAGSAEVAFALRLFELELELLQLFLDDIGLVDNRLFILPLGLETVGFLIEVSDFLLDLLQPILARVIFFFLKSLALHFELHGLSFELIDFCREAVEFDLETRRGFVDEVDGLVRKKSIRDVAIAQSCRGNDGGILDADTMVNFVALLDSTQDSNGVFGAGLIDHDGLETAFERRIFFDVFPIFVERRRSDGAELATGQLGFEQVRGIDRTFAGAGSDDRVELVDEEDDLSLALGDFLEKGLEAVFEFSAILGPGDHRSDVEHDEALVLE